MKHIAVVTAIVLAGSLLAFAETPSTRPSTATTLPIVTRDAWGSTPQPIDASRKQSPRLVTIHHAGVLWVRGGDPIEKVRTMQTWGQREKGWPDLPYHYLIAPDGRIIEGRDWHYQPESNTKYDLNGVLNIELFGNFEAQRVSAPQLRSLVGLIAYLKRDVGLDLDIPNIRGHKDAAGDDQTVCPGKDFYRYIHDGLIRTWVEQTLAGDVPAILELPALPDGPTTMIAETMPASK